MRNTEDVRLALTRELMPGLLAGTDPRLDALRRQWEGATIVIESETNWGFYAHFSIALPSVTVEPPDFCGGNASINVCGLRVPAGCILYVKLGRLSALEVYTHDEPWDDPPSFLSVSDVTPIIPGEPVRSPRAGGG
jgi:hypothetical protein